MNLRWVHIKNFRSCQDVEIRFGSMHALVGANNAGKSTNFTEISIEDRIDVPKLKIASSERIITKLTDSYKQGGRCSVRRSHTPAKLASLLPVNHINQTITLRHSQALLTATD